jgi:hypothetical protein
MYTILVVFVLAAVLAEPLAEVLGGVAVFSFVCGVVSLGQLEDNRASKGHIIVSLVVVDQQQGC